MGQLNEQPVKLKRHKAPGVNSFKQRGLTILLSNVDVTTKMEEIDRHIGKFNPNIAAFIEMKPKNYKEPWGETELPIKWYHTPVHNLDTKGRDIYMKTFCKRLFHCSTAMLVCNIRSLLISKFFPNFL